MAKSRGTLHLLRRTHEQRVLALLRSHGALSRGQLIERCGLSRTTMSEITGQLLARGVLCEEPVAPTGQRGRGRPASLLALNPNAGSAVGVDLGRRHVAVALANAAHEFAGARTRPCAAGAKLSQRARMAFRMVEEIAAEHDLDLAALEGVGLGLPGYPGGGAGSAHTDATQRVVGELEEKFGTSVAADNNTRLAALAEAVWGAGAGVQNLVYVNLSHGIGGGLVFGGELFRGARGTAAEFGHVVVDPEGPDCHCGRSGCLETFLGYDALLDEITGTAGHAIDPIDLPGYLDGPVAELIRRRARQVGVVLATATTMVDPGRIVLAGEVSRMSPLVGQAVEETVRSAALPAAADAVEVVSASLGLEAAAKGGVAWVFHRSSVLSDYQDLSDIRA